MQYGWRTVDRVEPIGERGMVAAKHRLASEAGARMFALGGNAIDAAIATAFASGVVEPMMSGLGGGGVMIVHDPADGQSYCVEFGMRSPALATPDCYDLAEGRSTEVFKWRAVKDEANTVGYRAVAVPGAVAGYTTALARWGRLPLATVIGPAIELAATALPVEWYHAVLVGRERHRLRRFPASAAIFLDDDAPPRAVDLEGVGGRLQQTDLARTLERIAADGPDAFYRGPLAAAIDADMRANDGLLRADDLAAYRAVIRPALTFPYRDQTVATVPGPFGGVTMAEMLRLLDGFDLSAGGPDAATFHLIAEASLLAFADRFAHLADSEVVPVPFAGLLTDEYIAARRALIDPARAATSRAAGDPWRYEPGGRPGALPPPSAPGPARSNTTHLCAADRDGLAVSLTSTLMSSFGSAVTIPGTGILLNNGMSWFDPEPGRAASLGPSRRPLTNQTPAIVLDGGKPRLVVGASGGRRILDAVAQIIIGHLDFGRSPQGAIGGARMDCSEGRLLIDDRVGQEQIDALIARGHTVKPIHNDFFGGGFASPTAIGYDPDGRLRGGADPFYPAIAIGV
ncbi:MAG: Gamma-glutamyltranspeptidase @ Glutathione hydrolase [uncultured Thermomicrobiales bacterium]|uniref:Glutathione hydrolase proenzyme n=1 Tax=uncultured Thermomicrobiales bacterium TaxID=1645740 RepID=A0A6J4UIK6_9BACT|nr:MAG: Gamma-glutamyltranspeptidase @ Glutathione hydrolase [uncultured Thermomicrobiales bacterium]